ncbi:MAG: hypothetical protein M1114_02720 [Candidatus Dependentiae bacterium]|nr:hypothetical protein [Candidatus Dependentiae bacterium]
MKKDKKEQFIKINPRELPIHIILEDKGVTKEYILRTNNKNDKLFLNKK